MAPAELILYNKWHPQFQIPNSSHVVHDEKWLYFYNQTYNRRDRPYLTKTNVTALNWIVTQSDHRRMSFARAYQMYLKIYLFTSISLNDEVGKSYNSYLDWIWFVFLFNLLHLTTSFSYISSNPWFGFCSKRIF